MTYKSMVANDIDIVTNSVEQEEANSINLRKVNGSYLLRTLDKNELDHYIKQHGTMVKLYVRNDVDRVLEVVYRQDVNTSSMFKQLLEERFLRVSSELIEKKWAKIDTNEFINKVLTKNYTLYSIDNWSRKEEVL